VEHPYAFDHLTYTEIRERSSAGWLAAVPTGCTEQQGPHLPVDFDTWFARVLLLAAAERAAHVYDVNALVLPAMPFGPTPEHRNYGSGYIDVPAALHAHLVTAVLQSLADQGFRRILVWRGCGGHALHSVVTRFNRDWAGRARAFLPALPYHEIWCRIGDPGVPGGHADSFATSIALHLRPDAVRTERIPAPETADVLWDDPQLDFTRYSRSGVIGDATHASAQLGARLWEAVVDAAARQLQVAAQQPLVRTGGIRDGKETT
jgi:creatinine amidohydrolase